MEKAQIFAIAKEKLGTTSLSERTIESYFDNARHLPAEGSEPDEAYWNNTVEDLKWYGEQYTGQHNHEVATARTKWEEEWNKNHPDPSTNNNPEPPANPEMDALMKRLKELEDEQKKNKAELGNAALRTSAKELASVLKVPADNNWFWNDAVARTAINEGMSQDDFVSAVKATYEANIKAAKGDGVMPYGSADPVDPAKQANKELDDFFARKFKK